MSSELSNAVTTNHAIVIMYATRFCPYCMMARRLLKKKGVEFEEIRASGDLWTEMEERSGRNTVPQIFIDDVSVGGYDDIAALDLKGELDTLLKIA